jgi:hypothetical protein
MQIITWLVAAMFAWAPARESERARYTEIATDLAAVTFDEAEAPLFSGESGRAETALLLASIAAHESTFRKEVDDGRVRGDSGRSWCFMQLHVGGGKTFDGWTGQDLVADRRKCFRAGLHIARWSFHSCTGVPLIEKLSAYASGSCGKSAESRQMTTRAMAYFKHRPIRDSRYYVEPSSALFKDTTGGATADNKN